jgi:hypothetical protein
MHIDEFIEDRAKQVKDPLPRWLAETGFAAGYFLKRFDLIPDQFRKLVWWMTLLYFSA